MQNVAQTGLLRRCLFLSFLERANDVLNLSIIEWFWIYVFPSVSIKHKRYKYTKINFTSFSSIRIIVNSFYSFLVREIVKLNLTFAVNFAVNLILLIERLRFTFTPNGRLEFIPRDQVSPLFSNSFTLYCFYTKISSFSIYSNRG